MGGMGEADQHHFGSTRRAARGFCLRNALEQHLPDARQCRHRDALRQLGAANALDLAQRLVVRGVGHIFQARDQMGEIGKVGEDHRRACTGLILRGELGERSGDVATDDMREKVDDAGPIGKAEHGANGRRLDHAAAMGDRLV